MAEAPEKCPQKYLSITLKETDKRYDFGTQSPYRKVAEWVPHPGPPEVSHPFLSTEDSGVLGKHMEPHYPALNKIKTLV